MKRFGCDYEAHCGFSFVLTCNVVDCCWHEHQNKWMTNEEIVVFVKCFARMHRMCLYEIEYRGFPHACDAIY